MKKGRSRDDHNASATSLESALIGFHNVLLLHAVVNFYMAFEFKQFQEFGNDPCDDIKAIDDPSRTASNKLYESLKKKQQEASSDKSTLQLKKNTTNSSPLRE